LQNIARGPFAGIRESVREIGISKLQVLDGEIVRADARGIDEKVESLKGARQEEEEPHELPASTGGGAGGGKKDLDDEASAQ